MASFIRAVIIKECRVGSGGSGGWGGMGLGRDAKKRRDQTNLHRELRFNAKHKSGSTGCRRTLFSITWGECFVSSTEAACKRESLRKLIHLQGGSSVIVKELERALPLGVGVAWA